MATYFLPTFASLAALGNWQAWHSDYLPVAAKAHRWTLSRRFGSLSPP